MEIYNYFNLVEDLNRQLNSNSNFEFNLAGTKKEDIKIKVIGDYLNIIIKQGIIRKVRLAKTTDRDKIKVKYENGMLKIEFKDLEEKVREISIE